MTYSWNADGSFVRWMPWDSVALNLAEEKYYAGTRALALRKQEGKHTIVTSERTAGEHTFCINIGTGGEMSKGFRCTPDDAGKDTSGVVAAELPGKNIFPKLPHLSLACLKQQ